ncbi:MAG: VrrA/YqfQ family protein [Ectobacillus sp.]
MLQRQMPPYQQPMFMHQYQHQPNHYPYPNGMVGMNQMQPRRQGFLAKLFGHKNPNPQEMYYMMNQQGGFTPMMMPNIAQQLPPASQSQQTAAGLRMMNPQATAGAATAARSTSGGIGSFFSNILSNPSSMIGNVEKIVQVAQTVGPVVQQYGPIVKNIPGLVKIFTAVSSADKADENSTAKNIDSVQKNKEYRTKTKTEPLEEVQVPVEQQKKTNGSAPKLYV